MGITRDALGLKRAGVIGAGGVARAIVAALRHYGADVIIYNRTVERAKRLAEEFSCRWAGLEELAQQPLDILVNGSSVGMHPDVGEMPLSEQKLFLLAKKNPHLVVFDTIYNPVRTRLSEEARRLGCLCVCGTEMFVNQAMEQFVFWTGRPADRDTLREIVLAKLRGTR
jgi:3-dehydroquinate dehydratase/shikimate dehydrogenase